MILTHTQQNEDSLPTSAETNADLDNDNDDSTSAQSRTGV